MSRPPGSFSRDGIGCTHGIVSGCDDCRTRWSHKATVDRLETEIERLNKHIALQELQVQRASRRRKQAEGALEVVASRTQLFDMVTRAITEAAMSPFSCGTRIHNARIDLAAIKKALGDGR